MKRKRKCYVCGDRFYVETERDEPRDNTSAIGSIYGGTHSSYLTAGAGAAARAAASRKRMEETEIEQDI